MKYQQSRYSRTTHRQRAAIQPWLWLVLAVLVFVGAGIVISTLQSGGSAGSATGTIKAEHTSFDFGNVPINGGIISTQFPLTMQEDVLVTSLTST